MEQAICVKRAAALINEFCKSKRRRFLIGVSGGPDSVALLHIILELKAQGQVEELYAAHLHHGIRQSADEDLAFVRNKCRYLGIALFEEQINVPELSVKTKTTLEAAARNARYSFLERARAASGASFILTAHHMGDQAASRLHIQRHRGGVGQGALQVLREKRLAHLDRHIGRAWLRRQFDCSRAAVVEQLVDRRADAAPGRRRG